MGHRATATGRKCVTNTVTLQGIVKYIVIRALGDGSMAWYRRLRFMSPCMGGVVRPHSAAAWPMALGRTSLSFTLIFPSLHYWAPAMAPPPQQCPNVPYQTICAASVSVRPWRGGAGFGACPSDSISKSSQNDLFASLRRFWGSNPVQTSRWENLQKCT